MLVIRIHNDGTGTQESSNYDWNVAVTTSPTDLMIIASGRVEGHDRRQSWDRLVEKILKIYDAEAVSRHGSDRVRAAQRRSARLTCEKGPNKDFSEPAKEDE